MCFYSLNLTLEVAMKLKNNDPGKISTKSDDWFKSYGQKVLKRTTVRNRVPGSNYPVPGYPDLINYPGG